MYGFFSFLLIDFNFEINKLGIERLPEYESSGLWLSASCRSSSSSERVKNNSEVCVLII